ncbi:hypothetical protein PC128_g18924 [Phytophthora cactorum]|nr:hypothetical protein PC128_g18924 [Phytophthora cactorum]
MLKRPAPTTAAPAAAGSTPPSPSPPTAKKKRRSQPMGNLTNLQKRQLCIKFSQVKMTQQELCHWAKREFQLTHLPHQSTISKILARSEELTQMAPRDLSARRKGLVTHPELDTALCNWVSAEDNASLSAASESIAVNDTPMADADQALTEATATKLQPETEAQTAAVSEAAMASSMTTVATLQPLGAGLIAAFKRRYRRYHMLYALDRFEAGRQDVFHVDQLQAMRWARHCWKQEIPEEIIRKCWAATETLVPRPNPETMAAFESIEEDIDKEICDTVSALEILRPLPIDEFVSPRDENSGIHCAGLEETDFVFTVPDNSGYETKPTTNKTSPSAADGAKQQVIMAPTELTPRLQELHARIEASASSAAAAAASGLGLTPTLTTMSAGDNTGSGSTAAGSVEDVLGLSSSAAKSVDGPATNEQLIECFKVLLPELDRLRFDDHTKKSIRTTFRKLKETVEQQALDRKRGITKHKPQTHPQFQSQVQIQEQQAQVQALQEMQQLQIQQMHQQLMMQPDQQAQAMAMAAQASQIGENTVL